MPQVMGILPVSSADSRLLNTRKKPRLARLPEPSTALTPRQFAPPNAFPVHGSYRPNRSTGLPTHSLVTYRHNWGEDRVYFHDSSGVLRSIPACWTVVPPDPFVVLAAGRSLFRYEDLLKLIDLVEKAR